MNYLLQTVSGFENCLPSKQIAPKIKVEPVGECSLILFLIRKSLVTLSKFLYYPKGSLLIVPTCRYEYITKQGRHTIWANGLANLCEIIHLIVFVSYMVLAPTRKYGDCCHVQYKVFR